MTDARKKAPAAALASAQASPAPVQQDMGEGTLSGARRGVSSERWIVWNDDGITSVIRDENNRNVAITYGHPRQSDRARLIAAAPALLDALKEMSDAIDEATDYIDVEGAMCSTRVFNAREAVRAAIALAETPEDR